MARAEALKEAYAAELAMPIEDRKRYLTGDWAAGLDEPTKEPEPEEPRNRFSGLDIE